jgi:hypothetical protein
MLTTLVVLIAFSSPDTFLINDIHKSKDTSNISIFHYVTNPATVTMSMGLLADAPLSCPPDRISNH